MTQARAPGWVVILNGAPRSGKSSLARAMQDRLDGIWINLGVDLHRQAAPACIQPSIGLRPGGERPDLEAHLPVLFAALYESVAAHSRLGLNVVVDIGHHDAHTRPLGILRDCVGRLAGLPVLVVGVHCALPAILERRARPQPGREGVYEAAHADGSVPAPVLAWQREVHRPGLYDLEVDTSDMTPEQCCDRVRDALARGVAALSAARRIAAGDGSPP